MLTIEKMREQVSKYQISFDTEYQQAYIIKGSGNKPNWVKVTKERAIEWVNAGIDDLECRSKERMLELLNKWH